MPIPERPRIAGKAAGPSTNCAPPTAEQLAAVRQFVAQVGGIENARSALELLAILNAAGHNGPQTAR